MPEQGARLITDAGLSAWHGDGATVGDTVAAHTAVMAIYEGRKAGLAL